MKENLFIIPGNISLEYQKDFDQKFTELMHGFSSEMLDYIKSKILETNNLFTKTSFQLELIVDTNILFSEVRSLMINGTSFFQTLMKNPFIKVYAPSQLKEELHAKIKLKFPKEKKTKNLNINECIEIADCLLSKITIDDNITKESVDKAKLYLQDRDENDISFVALNITLKKDGILTKDKDISDQPEIKTWQLSDVGKVLTEITKGAFSFIISNATIPEIWKIVNGIISLIWKSFLELSKRVLIAVTSLATNGIQAVTNPYVVLMIGVCVATYEYYKDDLKNIWESIKEAIKNVTDFFNEIWEIMRGIYDALIPVVKISVEMLSYFHLQSDNAIKALNKLESDRLS